LYILSKSSIAFMISLYKAINSPSGKSSPLWDYSAISSKSISSSQSDSSDEFS
jgi:hypothetical protein